jgi:hypothetical protein
MSIIGTNTRILLLLEPMALVSEVYSYNITKSICYYLNK